MAFLAAEQHTDALETAERLQEHLAVSQGQVAALDKADREFAGQKDMFKPQRVRMAATEQRHAAPVIGCKRLKRVAGDLQILPELLDPLGLKQLWHHPRQDAAVFQGVGQALCLSRAVSQYPPSAVRSAQHVGRVERQITFAAAAVDCAAGAEK